jgi:hypothetical protein
MKTESASPRRFVPMLLMASFAVVAMPAAADNPSMPGGQWRQTCEDATIRDGVLYARCRQDNGQYRATSALLQSTCGSYSNRNGQLYCERQGDSGAHSRWSGSYAQSCSDISVDKHGRLSASCRRDNGKSNRTNITPKQCPAYRAGNEDGKLVCEAQASSSNRWQGSFAKSCRDISVSSSGTLTATCQASNGTWQRTSLAAVNCNDYRADNRDGHLVCESQRVGENRWEGSFKQSCRDIYMDPSGTLTATCQNSNGTWVATRLAARNCAGYRAGNNNGQLVCESKGDASNRWDGSFRQSCRDISTSSAGVLTATCQAMNGSWQRTSLGTRQCKGRRAGNNNGRLVCES